VEPPELSHQELVVNEDMKSPFDKAAMHAKIANLEETVKMLEASADPERQSFKNELLRDELNAASERNRELHADLKALNTQEAKLRVQISDLETKVDGLEEVKAALSKDLDQECEESRAGRTNSEVYLQALQEITAISNKAIMIAPRERSEAGSLTVCRKANNLLLTSPSLISPASSPSASTLQPADSTYSKASPSSFITPPTPAFGSASRFGANSLVFDPKKPSFGFGNLALPKNKSVFKDGPEQPSSGLAPSKSAPSLITTHQARVAITLFLIYSCPCSLALAVFIASRYFCVLLYLVTFTTFNFLNFAFQFWLPIEMNTVWLRLHVRDLLHYATAKQLHKKRGGLKMVSNTVRPWWSIKLMAE